MKPTEIEKFDIYVTPLMNGNIGDIQTKPDLSRTKEIVNQLIDGLQQLKDAGKSHNDLKPGNILFRRVNNRLDIRISDFGQANKSGGTPGWTAPILRNRQPGKEDVYSMGWVILYMMCESKELFYALRDNFIKSPNQNWVANFRNLPEIQLVLRMTDLLNPPSVDDVRAEWQKMMANVQLITTTRLHQLGVPSTLLKPQYKHTR